MKALSSSVSNRTIAKTLTATAVVAIAPVRVSRLFHTEMSAAVSGGVFGGLKTLYFERRAKGKAS